MWPETLFGLFNFAEAFFQKFGGFDEVLNLENTPWSAVLKDSPGRKELLTTVRTIASKSDNHLTPAFGARTPTSLLPGDLHLLVSKMKGENISACYINRCLVVLKAILHYGFATTRWENCPRSPKNLTCVRSCILDS